MFIRCINRSYHTIHIKVFDMLLLQGVCSYYTVVKCKEFVVHLCWGNFIDIYCNENSNVVIS